MIRKEQNTGIGMGNTSGQEMIMTGLMRGTTAWPAYDTISSLKTSRYGGGESYHRFTGTIEPSAQLFLVDYRSVGVQSWFSKCRLVILFHPLPAIFLDKCRHTHTE